MTNTGIRRKVDDLGRVVIPAGIRRSLSIREGDAVEVHVEGEQVILSKPTDRCVFCGEEEGLETFREKAVCRGCVAGVGVLDDSMRASRSPEPAVAEPARRDASNLPPWPVGDRRGNGGALAARQEEDERPSPRERSPQPAPAERSEAEDERPPQPRREPPRRDDRGQGPPASTTAW